MLRFARVPGLAEKGVVGGLNKERSSCAMTHDATLNFYAKIVDNTRMRVFDFEPRLDIEWTCIAQLAVHLGLFGTTDPSSYAHCPLHQCPVFTWAADALVGSASPRHPFVRVWW